MKSKCYKLKDIIFFNPIEKLKIGVVAKKVPMEALRPYKREIQFFENSTFNGGSKFRNKDTLVARITPCLENGKTVQVSGLSDGETAFGSTEFIVMRAKEEILNPDYMYYLAISKNFRDVAISSMIGSSGRQRVQIDVLKDMEISLPSMENQIAISSVLKNIDDKILMNRNINDNLAA